MVKRTREGVIRQMLSATTAQEIAGARRVQKTWLKAHPGDRFPLLQVGEQLTMLERITHVKRKK